MFTARGYSRPDGDIYREIEASARPDDVDDVDDESHGRAEAGGGASAGAHRPADPPACSAALCAAWRRSLSGGARAQRRGTALAVAPRYSQLEVELHI